MLLTKSKATDDGNKRSNRHTRLAESPKGTGKSLSDSEERYRRLFESAQEGIVLTSPSGQILDCNPALCERTGYTREELIGMQASRLLDKEAREKIVRALQDTGRAESLRIRLRRKREEDLLCLVSAFLWTDEEGNPTAIQSFVRDVTGEGRVREALAESEEKFRTLAENAPVGIGLLQETGSTRGKSSKEWTITYTNPTLAQIFGYAPSEIVGRSPKELVHWKDWPSLQEWFLKRLNGEGTPCTKTQGVTKSGHARHLKLFGGRATYEEKPVLIGGIVDVTEHRQLQREILEVQEEERRSIGQELHDGIASQFTGARIRLSNLAGRVEEESVARRIREIESAIEESTDELRKLSHGLRPGGLSEGDLPAALRGLAASVEEARFEAPPQDEIGDVELASVLEEETATHLYRIAQEAISNARVHGQCGELVIRLGQDEGTLLLEIEDDGRGFDPDSLKKNESLGLRSMRHRAELIGAGLAVESAPEEGTLVRVRLPL